MDLVTLVNVTNMAITVSAADGEELTLPPLGEHSVPAKFNWNLPPQIKAKKAAAVPVDKTAQVAVSVNVPAIKPGK